MLFSMAHSGDLKEDGYDEENETLKYFPEDIFEIYPPREGEKGRERLFEIIKEQDIADDFPISCRTEEALEILKKILG